MRQFIAVFTLATAVALPATHDPVKTLPDSYSLQFENDWIKIVRVRYGPFAKLPAHAHTPRASAYVYLNDAGPVLFRHVGEKTFAATRPATQAGSFRIFRGIEEIHEVENTSGIPSEFLRVEFKTDPKDVSTLRGRYFREPVAAGENLEKVQFENGQIRITRLLCASGTSLRVVTPETEPALLLELTASGREHWIPAGRSETLENGNSEHRELLRFDFKTSPIRGADSRTGRWDAPGSGAPTDMKR